MHQSISSANMPPGKPPGNVFDVVKSPTQGQNFSAKARPPRQNTYTGEYFRRSSQPLLLIGVEILQKSNLKKNWKAVDVQLFFGHIL